MSSFSPVTKDDKTPSELHQSTIRSSNIPLYFSKPFALQEDKEKLEHYILEFWVWGFVVIYFISVIILINAVSK